MATLVLLAMFSFIVLGTIDIGSRSGGDGSGNEVLGTWKFGDITTVDFDQRSLDRSITNAFLRGVFELVRQNDVEPQSLYQWIDRNGNPLLGQDEREIGAAILLTRKAQELGVAFSDDAINHFIKSITSDGKDVGLSQTQIRNLIASLNFGGRRISEGRLFDALRTELATRQVERLFGVDTSIDVAASPAERWEYFRRLNRRITAQVIPIKVADFIDQVPEPTEAQLVAFYNAHKDRESDPYVPEVGFKQPQRVAFEYLKFDRVKFIESAREQVKEEEIQQRFDSNKEHYRRAAEGEMTTDVLRLRGMLDEPGDPGAKSEAEKKPQDEKGPDAQPQDSDAKPEPSPKDKDPKKTETDAAVKDDSGDTKKVEKSAPEKSTREKSAEAPKTKTPGGEREGGPGGGAEGADEPKSPALNPATDTAKKPADSKPKVAPEGEKKSPSSDPDAKSAETKQPETKTADKKEPPKPESAAKEEAAKTKSTPRPPEPPISDEEVLTHPKVRSDIIDRLARDKAENAIHDRVRALQIEMEKHSAWRKWRRENPTAPLAQAPKFNLAALADEKQGITYHSTGLVSRLEALRDLEIFKTAVDRQYRQTDGIRMPQPNSGSAFDRVGFGNQSAYVPHRAEELDQLNFNPDWFLFWRVNEQAAYTPTLADTVKGMKAPDGKIQDIAVREIVRRAWRIANTDGPTSARKLATARAETLAKDANVEDKPLAAKYGKISDAPEKQMEVLEIGPFRFLERETTPTDGFALKRRPRLPRLEQLEDAGEEFFKSVFALQNGQVGVAKNAPETTVYVVQVFDSADSTPERLREEFTRSQYLSFNIPHPEYGQQGDSAASTPDYINLQRSWLEQLGKEYAVEWKRPLGVRDGDLPEG
jgi:hypothetical protein